MKHYFTKTELILWCTSAAVVFAAFHIFDRTNYMTLIASLIGVTSLIFNAKGNPFGQLLMVLFSILYGIIRSPYFALAYAANDMVLILLWALASVEHITYLSALICFAMFLINDLYGFISWRRMEMRQTKI